MNTGSAHPISISAARVLLVFLVGIGISASVFAQPVPQKTTSPSEKTSKVYPVAWSTPIEGSILSDPLLLSDADKALDHLYNMRFEKADSIFSRIEKRYLQHPIGPFLKSLTQWWHILSTLTVHDTSQDKAFLAQMDLVIDLSAKLTKKKQYEFDAMFFRTAAYGFRGRLLSDRENWLRAAQDGKSALDDVFKLAEKDPMNADLLFGAGVYEYFAVAMPEQYPIVKPILFFFPEGNKERGIERLEIAARHGRFVSAEAAYFLLQIYSTFQPDYEKSIDLIAYLRGRYPGNALFHVMEGRILFRWGQWERAATVFTQIEALHQRKVSGYNNELVSQAHYYLGRNEMLRGDDAVALSHFQKVIALESRWKYESFFRVHATLRAGMISDRLGDRKKAVQFYNRVLKMENQSTSRDRAKKYLKTPYGGGE